MNLKFTPTICPYCGCGCGLNLVSIDGKLVDVEPWRRNPVNEGKLCSKGNFSHEFVHSEDRLTNPLIKENGEFRKASWDEALDLVVKNFIKIKNESSEFLGFLGSGKCTNEENYLMQKFVRTTIGNNNMDHCARLCHSPTVAGLNQSFGSSTISNYIEDIIESDCILIIGSNPIDNHPLVGRRLIQAKEKGAKIIVIDPRYTSTGKIADIYLSIKPGTNVAMLNSIMNVIIEENLEDNEFIKKRTKGYDILKETIIEYTPEYCETITGVPANEIRKIAIEYGKSNKSAIVYCMGITQHSDGTDSVLSVSNLAMLSGNLGKEGTGVYPLRGQNNVQGASDMGVLPFLYPGYRSVDDRLNSDELSKLWSSDKLLPMEGLTMIEMFDSTVEGYVKGMYIIGENPMMSDPNIQHVEEELKNLEFLVVQDIFLTETGRLADVVLPATSWAEKDGTFTNTERKVQYIHKAIEPIGNSRPDWEIICDIAKRMGSKLFEFSSTQEIFEEIRTIVPQYAGMNKERLKKPEGLYWPCWDENHPGTPILHKEHFNTIDGLATFHPISYKDSPQQTDDEYPFILTTGRISFHWHTGTMTRRSKTLHHEVPTGYVEINTNDAEKLGIQNENLVKVSTLKGKIELPAYVTNNILEGILFIPFHFAECAANVLTNADNLDPVSKIPAFKITAANLEKV